MVGRASGAALRAGGDRHRSVGHRDRHRPGKAAPDLRGVPAGRRRHEPQVRRHRPRPGDQPRAGDAARRRDPAGQRARQGQHVHASICRSCTRVRRDRSPLRRAARVVDRRSGQADFLAARPRGRAGGDRPRRPRYDRRGRQHPADRRRRSALRQGPARTGARQRLQGDCRASRHDRADPGASVPADGDYAGRVPARHARLDVAEQSEARPRHSTHSRADPLG